MGLWTDMMVTLVNFYVGVAHLTFLLPFTIFRAWKLSVEYPPFLADDQIYDDEIDEYKDDDPESKLLLSEIDAESSFEAEYGFNFSSGIWSGWKTEASHYKHKGDDADKAGEEPASSWSWGWGWTDLGISDHWSEEEQQISAEEDLAYAEKQFQEEQRRSESPRANTATREKPAQSIWNWSWGWSGTQVGNSEDWDEEDKEERDTWPMRKKINRSGTPTHLDDIATPSKETQKQARREDNKSSGGFNWSWDCEQTPDVANQEEEEDSSGTTLTEEKMKLVSFKRADRREKEVSRSIDRSPREESRSPPSRSSGILRTRSPTVKSKKVAEMKIKKEAEKKLKEQEREAKRKTEREKREDKERHAQAKYEDEKPQHVRLESAEEGIKPVRSLIARWNQHVEDKEALRVTFKVAKKLSPKLSRRISPRHSLSISSRSSLRLSPRSSIRTVKRGKERTSIFELTSRFEERNSSVGGAGSIATTPTALPAAPPPGSSPLPASLVTRSPAYRPQPSYQASSSLTTSAPLPSSSLPTSAPLPSSSLPTSVPLPCSSLPTSAPLPSSSLATSVLPISSLPPYSFLFPQASEHFSSHPPVLASSGLRQAISPNSAPPPPPPTQPSSEALGPPTKAATSTKLSRLPVLRPPARKSIEKTNFAEKPSVSKLKKKFEQTQFVKEMFAKPTDGISLQSYAEVERSGGKPEQVTAAPVVPLGTFETIVDAQKTWIQNSSDRLVNIEKSVDMLASILLQTKEGRSEQKKDQEEKISPKSKKDNDAIGKNYIWKITHSESKPNNFSPIEKEATKREEKRKNQTTTTEESLAIIKEVFQPLEDMSTASETEEEGVERADVAEVVPLEVVVVVEEAQETFEDTEVEPVATTEVEPVASTEVEPVASTEDAAKLNMEQTQSQINTSVEAGEKKEEDIEVIEHHDADKSIEKRTGSLSKFKSNIFPRKKMSLFQKSLGSSLESLVLDQPDSLYRAVSRVSLTSTGLECLGSPLEKSMYTPTISRSELVLQLDSGQKNCDCKFSDKQNPHGRRLRSSRESTREFISGIFKEKVLRDFWAVTKEEEAYLRDRHTTSSSDSE